MRWRLTVVGVVLGCGPGVPASSGSGGSGGASMSGPTDGTQSSTTARPTASGGGVTGTESGGTTDVTGAGSSTSGTPADLGSCLRWAMEECGAPQPRPTMVMAETPLGPFVPTLAYFASQTGCDSCVDPNVHRIILVGQTLEVGQMSPWSWEPEDGLILDLGTFGYEGPAGQPANDLLTAYRDGMSESKVVQFVLDDLPSEEDLDESFDPNQPATIAGSLDAEDGEWSVHGTFNAVYCPALNDYYICE